MFQLGEMSNFQSSAAPSRQHRDRLFREQTSC